MSSVRGCSRGAETPHTKVSGAKQVRQVLIRNVENRCASDLNRKKLVSANDNYAHEDYALAA